MYLKFYLKRIKIKNISSVKYVTKILKVFVRFINSYRKVTFLHTFCVSQSSLHDPLALSKNYDSRQNVQILGKVNQGYVTGALCLFFLS